MNNTFVSSNVVQNNPPGQNFSGLSKYVVVIWIACLFFIVAVTYCSYICKRSRSRSRLSSTHRSYFITTIAFTENRTASPREGIDENTLNQYPKLLYSDESLHHKGITASGCSICLADYIGSDIIRLLPECGHIFHLNCIDPWLRMHATCPICRTPPGPSPLRTPVVEVLPIASAQA